jgi:3-deoxy-D-arabino-heptulosonate 7-phosphate (DAHP) synthase
MSKTGHNVSYATVCKAFDDRKVSDFTESELSDFVDVLCDDGIKNEEHQTRALLRIASLTHVQMRGHLTKLDAANARTQKWFMVLAVASLIGTVVQALVAAAFYFGHPSVSRSDEQASSKAVQCDTQQHDAASKVDPTKSTPPPAKK